MTGADWGALISAIVVLASLYEFVAILNPRLPTISRVLQGWRDSGGFRWVLGLVVFIAIALGVFTAWLVRHLLHERRSDL